MGEISSGLVAFCYMSDRYEVALFSEPPTDPLYDDMFPVVRLSDADALISAKDAEIERLDGECNRLAKAASKNYRDNGLPINEEFYKQAEMIEKQSAALKLAKDAFSASNTEAKAFMSYENARNNFSDDTDERKAYERAMMKASELTKKALAAIDALGEVK